MPTPNDFSNYQFGASNSAERRNGKLRVSGDHGQVDNAPDAPAVPVNDYPNLRGYGYDAGNSQFSQDKENDPLALLESTRAAVASHPALNASYGLFQPIATVGSHPWLRDGLATPADDEPANAAPFPDAKCRSRAIQRYGRHRTIRAIPNEPRLDGSATGAATSARAPNAGQPDNSGQRS